MFLLRVPTENCLYIAGLDSAIFFSSVVGLLRLRAGGCGSGGFQGFVVIGFRIELFRVLDAVASVGFWAGTNGVAAGRMRAFASWGYLGFSKERAHGCGGLGLWFGGRRDRVEMMGNWDGRVSWLWMVVPVGET